MTLDDYMRVNYPLMIREIRCNDEHSYEFKIPDLPGLVIYADSIDDGYRKIERAKREWLTLALKIGINIPKPTIDIYVFTKDT